MLASQQKGAETRYIQNRIPDWDLLVQTHPSDVPALI
jgi:hypothetical protein